MERRVLWDLSGGGEEKKKIGLQKDFKFAFQVAPVTSRRAVQNGLELAVKLYPRSLAV